MAENCSSTKRLRYYQIAVLFLINMFLIGVADSLLHFPIPHPLDSSLSKISDGQLSDDQIIQDITAGAIRIFTIADTTGAIELHAFEQSFSFPRCRILKVDIPASLPWHYYIRGNSCSTTLIVTETGSISIQETKANARIIVGKYFLVAIPLVGIESLLYKICTKKRQLHKTAN